MTKAEPNINPDIQAEEPSQKKETLKLPESKDTQPPAPPPSNDLLNDTKNMTAEEIDFQSKKMGYIPNEDFKGDMSRHMSAEEFLIASERKMPALKNQIRKQDTIIDNLLTINKHQYEQNIEQQKTLTIQMQEASDEQDLVKFRNLEKQEATLEKRQETLQANLVNLENNQQEEITPINQENLGREAKSWASQNIWYNQPQTQGDIDKRKFADGRFNELSAKYPNADPVMIFNQINADLSKLSQSKSSSYGYNPGGDNQPMGQSPSKDKTIANLNEGGLRALRNMQSVARSEKEKERLTKSYLASSTNDSLFKWYKNNK